MHYHTGVDIFEPTNTSVYAIAQGSVFFPGATESVEMRHNYELSTDIFEVFRYLHVKNYGHLLQGDSLIWDLSKSGCFTDVNTGRRMCPIHVALGAIDEDNHLHFEHVHYNNFSFDIILTLQV